MRLNSAVDSQITGVTFRDVYLRNIVAEYFTSLVIQDCTFEYTGDESVALRTQYPFVHIDAARPSNVTVDNVVMRDLSDHSTHDQGGDELPLSSEVVQEWTEVGKGIKAEG